MATGNKLNLDKGGHGEEQTSPVIEALKRERR
jgi:hypothetical protein